MPIDVSLLTTVDECDEVLSSLEAELAGYQNRDTNLDFADSKAGYKDASKAKRLAQIEADIDLFQYSLAKTDLSKERREEYTTKLRRANDLRDNLRDPGVTKSAPKRILADVDADQVDAQVTVLTDAQTKVSARRAELAR